MLKLIRLSWVWAITLRIHMYIYTLPTDSSTQACISTTPSFSFYTRWELINLGTRFHKFLRNIFMTNQSVKSLYFRNCQVLSYSYLAYNQNDSGQPHLNSHAAQLSICDAFTARCCCRLLDASFNGPQRLWLDSGHQFANQMKCNEFISSALVRTHTCTYARCLSVSLLVSVYVCVCVLEHCWYLPATTASALCFGQSLLLTKTEKGWLLTGVYMYTCTYIHIYVCTPSQGLTKSVKELSDFGRRRQRGVSSMRRTLGQSQQSKAPSSAQCLVVIPGVGAARPFTYIVNCLHSDNSLATLQPQRRRRQQRWLLLLFCSHFQDISVEFRCIFTFINFYITHTCTNIHTYVHVCVYAHMFIICLYYIFYAFFLCCCFFLLLFSCCTFTVRKVEGILSLFTSPISRCMCIEYVCMCSDASSVWKLRRSFRNYLYYILTYIRHLHC